MIFVIKNLIEKCIEHLLVKLMIGKITVHRTLFEVGHGLTETINSLLRNNR